MGRRRTKLTYVELKVTEGNVAELVNEIQAALVKHGVKAPITQRNLSLLNWTERKLIANREEEQKLAEIME